MRKLAVIIGVLSLATAANAAVVVTRLANLGVPLYQQTYHIDLDLDGANDLYIESTSSQFGAFGGSGVRFYAVTSTPPDIGSYAVPFTLGSLVGASTTFPAVWHNASEGGTALRVCTDLFCVGHWPSGTFVTEDPLTGFLTIFPESGYLGIEITKPDGVHYGWVDVGVIGFAPVGRIYGWGYETQAGVPAQISVPEPSLGALFFIGCTATLLCRRRQP
jgi:hypothetical protein